MAFVRRLRLLGVVAAAALLLAACGNGPDLTPSHTGEGWAPFLVWVQDNNTPAKSGRQQYEPVAPVKSPLTICVVLPALDTPGLPNPGVVRAYQFGITTQAAREHVAVRVLYGSTNARQLQQAQACAKTTQRTIIDLIDPTTASGAVPVAALNDVVFLGAYSASTVALNAGNQVLTDTAEQARTAAQWVIGESGGLAGTVVLLPGAGSVARPDGSTVVDNFAELAAKKALQRTQLKVVGTYYGPDTLTAQRALVLQAMRQHPGLSFIIGTATAATAAGDLFATMNTNRRPQAVATDLTPELDTLIRQGAVAAAMSASEVVQGRIALDRAVRMATAPATPGVRPSARTIWPIALPIDGTNVTFAPNELWSAPLSGAK